MQVGLFNQSARFARQRWRPDRAVPALVQRCATRTLIPPAPAASNVHSALIKWSIILPRIAEGRRLYLEATSPDNRRLYLRHGFQ